jgi:hypothetical protein
LGRSIDNAANQREVACTQIQIGKRPITQITIEAEPEKQAEALSVATASSIRWHASQDVFPSACIAAFDGRRIVELRQWDSRICCGLRTSQNFARPGSVRKLTDEIDPHLYEVAEILDGEQ